MGWCLRDFRLPMALLMMLTSIKKLLLIYYRYPPLAFLLAICNVSTILSGLNSIHYAKSVQHARHMLHSKRSKEYRTMMDRFFSIWLLGLDKPLKTLDFVYDLVLHLIAICIATIIMWRAVLLGIRGVMVFACWTWHEPYTWVGVGGLVHLLSTIAWRLCLGPINSAQPRKRRHWIICRSGGNLTLAHPRLARDFDLCPNAWLNELRLWYCDVKWNYPCGSFKRSSGVLFDRFCKY